MGKRILCLFVFLTLIAFVYGETVCSYQGPDTSEHAMHLTNLVVSSDSLSMGNQLTVSFDLQNVGKTPVQLYTNGIYAKAETPSGEKILASDYQNREMGALENLSFNKTITLDESGQWVIWPSYNISGAAAEIIGPDYWHSCSLYVCPQGCQCLTENNAGQLFSGFERCSDDVCGYDEFQKQKRCFREIDADSDDDGIENENDLCPNEPETFNSFNDSDGCPDEEPKECSEEELCLTQGEAKKNGYEFIKPAKVCGYEDYRTPKYCSEPKKKPDLMVQSALAGENKVKYVLKNQGEKDASAFMVEIKLNNKTIYSKEIKSLEKEEEIRLVIEREMCVLEKEEFEIIVDPENRVEESNEQNNSLRTSPECGTKETGLPSLEITGINRIQSPCGYRFGYKIQNNSNRTTSNIPVALNINSQLFDQDMVGAIGAGQMLERDFVECWNPNSPINEFEIDAGGFVFNFRETIIGWLVPSPRECLAPCSCVLGEETPLEIGYFPCFESMFECPGSRMNLGSVSTAAFCYILHHFYEDWPCPPMNANFGYGEERVFHAEFSGWDEFVAGDVLGDELDELIIARDDSGGKILVYDGTGNLLLDTGIRFTPNDRLATGDVFGDEKDELIIAVDEDAPGDDGMIYVYSITGTAPVFAVAPIIAFTARFTKYDAVIAGDLLGRAKEQIAIAIDEDDVLYVYDVSSGSLESMQADFPVDIRAFSYSEKAGDNSYDEIFLANVLDSGNDEIVFLENNNNLEGKSKAYVMRFHEGEAEIELMSKIGVPFTKYDRATTGDVLGDELEEILIGIDEHNSVYVVDALTGIIKVHPRRWTKYDELAAGHFFRLDKMQSAIATDEDDLIRIAMDEELIPGVGP